MLKHGQKKQIAEQAGVTPTHLYEILHRRRVPSAHTAKRIAAAMHEQNIAIHWLDIMDCENSTHPIFK